MLNFQQPSSKIPHLNVKEGERILLLGPTGSGKTTILKQIVMLQDGKTSQVFWNGDQVNPETVSHYRSQCMLLSQNGFRSDQGLKEHIDEVLSLKVYQHLDSKTCTQELQELLMALGLNHILEKDLTLREISGGELQGFSIARSLILKPKLLLLDESTSAMDQVLKQKAESLLNDYYEGAWIWVSHDSAQVERLLQRGARTINL